MAELKRPEDFVKLVNQTDKPVRFAFDGHPYEVEKHLTVRRDIAELGVKQGYSATTGTSMLRIEELPEGARTMNDISKAGERLDAALKENEELKSRNAYLEARVADLEGKAEKAPEVQPAPKGKIGASKKSA